MQKIINSSNAPSAIGPYSQAIEINGTLYISGQIPFVPETMELVSQDVSEQTQQVLNNIHNILLEAGYTKDNVVKCGIFCTNLEEFTKINDIYSEYFDQHQPARFCVEVSRLPKDVKVEIDCIAVK